jgi:hypothetical protein
MQRQFESTAMPRILWTNLKKIRTHDGEQTHGFVDTHQPINPSMTEKESTTSWIMNSALARTCWSLSASTLLHAHTIPSPDSTKNIHAALLS